MKVSLDFKQMVCVVEREAGDPVFYGVIRAKGESRLLYHVKNLLNKKGYDFVKKRMWRDGHMVDEFQQYLRERNKRSKRCLAIYNNRWAIEGAEEVLNREGKVSLSMNDLSKK